MINTDENLPGYKTKSFTLYYNGGEIWFEHLDGIYDYEELVLKKLSCDIPKFTRPSSSSFICFVLDETTVTETVSRAVKSALTETNKKYMKVAFCGLDNKWKSNFKKEFKYANFAVGFFDGLEDAKMWLIP